MSQAMILDTELSGLLDPDVVQLAAKGPLLFDTWHQGDTVVEHFKLRPGKTMSIGAMATNRIIAEDLEDFMTWPGSYQLPSVVGYLIGHGIDIDWTAIGAPHAVKRIDTLALAKRYWPDLDSYKLVALIYHLVSPRVAREMTTNAHVASVDIGLTEFVLDNLLEEIDRARDPSYPALNSWEVLWEISEQARIPIRMGFSKYGPKNGKPGTLYTEVPTGMLEWMVDPVRIKEMDPWEVKAAQQQLSLRGVHRG